MKPINILFSILAIVALGSAAGCNQNGGDDDMNTAMLALAAQAAAPTATTPAAPDAGQQNLAQPADGTAILVLGGETFTLTNQLACQTGATGLGLQMVDADNLPAVFVHNIDFAAATGVSVGTGGSVLDIDLATGGYTPSANCAATIMENTAGIYDVQVMSCPLQTSYGSPVPATTTASFRIRCVK